MALSYPTATAGPSKQPDPAQDGATFALPTRRTYLTTLSAVAFASGIGIATVVTIRRGRKMRLEDAQMARRASLHISSTRTAAGPVQGPSTVAQAVDDTPLGRASSRGVFALFREMNRAIVRRDDISYSASSIDDNDKRTTGFPSVLRRSTAGTSLGRTMPSSVFDASPSAPPPSALMRLPKRKQEEAAAVNATPQRPSTSTETAAPTASAAEAVPFGETPVVLAIKAIAIATTLVGACTWIAIEVACRVLQVKDVDELVERLTSIVPASERSHDTFSAIGQTARQSLHGVVPNHDADMDTATAPSDQRLRQADQQAPLPVHEAVQQLDAAIERGDAAAWMEILSQQLNAERREDLAQRQKRMQQAATPASL